MADDAPVSDGSDITQALREKRTATQQVETVDAPLGPEGEKALSEWKSRAKDAEKRAKERDALEARLRQYEEKDKSEVEKWTSRANEAGEKLTATQQENLRLRTALAKSLPLELADRLKGDSAEEMAADADRLLALVAPARASSPPSGGFDPGVRQSAPEGSDMNRLIRQQLGR